MDILAILFVLMLFAIGIFLTLNVRRDFIAKEDLQRQRRTRPPNPRRTP
jgi:hypothetical protein